MEVRFNVDLKGNAFDQATIDEVWGNAIIIEHREFDPDYTRKDICDSYIIKGYYGKQEKCGWEIDHIKPIAKGGTDNISNLQPLYWENNKSKADNYPWKC